MKRCVIDGKAPAVRGTDRCLHHGGVGLAEKRKTTRFELRVGVESLRRLRRLAAMETIRIDGRVTVADLVREGIRHVLSPEWRREERGEQPQADGRPR